MTTSLVVARLLPDLLGINGSAGNADIFVATLTRMGHHVVIVDVNQVGDCPHPPDVVVVGSGSTSALHPALTALIPLASVLNAWAEAGVPFVAVGMGWDVLGQDIVDAQGTTIPGVGVFATSADYRPGRFSGEVAGSDYRGRPLAGYINQVGTSTRHRGEPLATITQSAKPIDREEGVVDGHLLGTKLGGPVMSLNPSLRDDVLDIILTRSNQDLVADCTHPGFTEFHTRVDSLAARAKAGIVQRLG
jgi:CobQ-like glutamine amidotransferase family enzyme